MIKSLFLIYVTILIMNQRAKTTTQCTEGSQNYDIGKTYDQNGDNCRTCTCVTGPRSACHDKDCDNLLKHDETQRRCWRDFKCQRILFN